MKESKKKENSGSKKKKHTSTNVYNLDTWDQNDLEDADEKVLERRLHQLKLQLQMAQDETFHESKHSSSKRKKKHIAEEIISTDSDSSESGCTISSGSSSSFIKYNVKKSPSQSDVERKKRQRSSPVRKKFSKELKSGRTVSKSDRENISNIKIEKKIAIRRRTSPVIEKRPNSARIKRSPSLDKKELYNRLDTNRWHDKANEYAKERAKYRENENQRTRAKSRTESIRSSSLQKELRIVPRAKEARLQRKAVGRITTFKTGRIRNSPELARNRLSHDAAPARRMTVITRKISPRNEKFGRHNERRLHLKVTRRNDVRAGDIRDVNLRITRDVRNHKESVTKLSENIREREMIAKSHREMAEHRIDVRERNRINEDRFKDRDTRLHDRIEPERNIRNIRNDTRDTIRNDRSIDVNRGGGGGGGGNNRHANESVFDRIRNRYNDRRNAENNQRLGRIERDVRKDKSFEKEPIKGRNVDSNGADRSARDRRINLQTQQRNRSPYRDRKELDKAVMNRAPVAFERKFSSPLNSKKVREVDNRLLPKRKSLENDDAPWNRKKGINKIRSRSRSSEKRKRRRSSQEEWRVIDMTSPVFDDELSDDENSNKQSMENNVQNKLLKRPTPSNKLKQNSKNEQNEGSETCKQNKTILTDELSDISDEDFNDVNANSTIRNKKDFLIKNGKKNEKIRKADQNVLLSDREDELNNGSHQDNQKSTNEVDDLICDQKSTVDNKNSRVEVDKNESLDSEEETVSRVSDALGVDWSDLVEESKKNTPFIDDSLKCVRQRWNTKNVFTKIGISKKYAGEELFNDIEKDLIIVDEKEDKINQETSGNDEISNKILNDVPGVHVCLRDRAVKKRILFEPYRTAISARKDITIRRRLCNLPVKSLRSQHMIGMCHWIV